MLASTKETLASADVAMAMRELSGSCAGAARQGILATVDAESLGSDEDQEVYAVYKTAKKHGCGVEERRRDPGKKQ